MKICIVISLLVCLAKARVYFPATYNNLGCWRDKADRAIPMQEGRKRPLLDGDATKRDDAIQKCARVANVAGYEVFGVQYGGQCMTSFKARQTYRKYGESNRCGRSGKGGTWANQVYELRSTGRVFTRWMGCWRDTSDRAIPTLERLDDVLDGNYKKRKDALKKCVTAAFARGYKVIALQNGGWCAGSKDAWFTYKRYGPSKACDRRSGLGGPWANQVYQLLYARVSYYNR